MELMAIVVNTRSVKTLKWVSHLHGYTRIKHPMINFHNSTHGEVNVHKVATVLKTIDYRLYSTRQTKKLNKLYLTRASCFLNKTDRKNPEKIKLRVYGVGLRSRLLLKKPSFKLWVYSK